MMDDRFQSVEKDVRRLDIKRAENDRRARNSELEDIIVDSGRKLILRSPNGHFWSIGVSNAGAFTATDLGTTLS